LFGQLSEGFYFPHFLLNPPGTQLEIQIGSYLLVEPV